MCHYTIIIAAFFFFLNPLLVEPLYWRFICGSIDGGVGTILTLMQDY